MPASSLKVSALTGKHNYFEDFTVGDVMKHARGKTVEPMEQVWITNVTMNTAEAHFNEHLTQFGVEEIAKAEYLARLKEALTVQGRLDALPDYAVGADMLQAITQAS